ncbi:chemotaxis protein CheY [Collibacillus ludicampi]|jgi:two-component system chemotaxis response regulator CheY|uniref:Chemotaxis protein CheY n=2 Tax=Collibacillus ludicampi TaxID=2771369 RepID=A0AAV4LA86_9BACL|nr:chemotaxis protein CheY [Collibacillus ludicampi]
MWEVGYEVMARIMIVDDAAFMRSLLRQLLTSNGHEVVAEASNAEEAVRKYQEIQPDLVTMDITMPDMDGIEGLKRILGLDPHAKVIMCSAMGQQAMVVEAIKAGAKDFIVKPFDSKRVIEAIESVLR